MSFLHKPRSDPTTSQVPSLRLLSDKRCALSHTLRLLSKSITLALSGLVSANAADATDYTGKIISITGSGATNYAFRVYLDSGMGSCTYSFAFINANDDNYQVKVSTLLTAFSLGKSVTLTTVAGVGGLCQIGDLTVQPS